MKHVTRFVLAFVSLVSLSLAVPALAHAADAYVTGNVNLRAGPDPSYPLIDRIAAGTEVDVQGCTDGWEWCDVIVYGNRGWVAGNYIEYEYQDQPVLLPRYGAQIGIPIISFTIGSYWDNYYRGRPFYRDRDHWYHRRIERRPAPPPIRHPYRRPVHGNARPTRPTHPGPMGPRRIDQGHRPPQQQRSAPRLQQRTAPSRPAQAAPTPHPAPTVRQQARPAAPARHAAPVQQVHPIHDNRSQGTGHPPPAKHDANGKKPPAARDKKNRHDHDDGH
jgi:uncharacterized protein YraI